MNNRVYRAARPRKTQNGIPIHLAYEIGQAMREHWNNYTLKPDNIVFDGVIDDIQVFSYLITLGQNKMMFICAKMPDGKKKYREIYL